MGSINDSKVSAAEHTLGKLRAELCDIKYQPLSRFEDFLSSSYGRRTLEFL